MTTAQADRGDAPTIPELAVPLLLQPYTTRGLTLRNRIVISPMCMYSCEPMDGLANEWHMVHLGSRAVGGAGLVIVEASAVVPEGRITPQDLGIWSDAHGEALAPIVRFAKTQGAAMGIQLAHAGRKAGTIRPWDKVAGNPDPYDDRERWTPVGPSPIPWGDRYVTPHALAEDEIQGVIQAFVDATRRAERAGFDLVELHAAHGYLLHSFLSPMSNQRTDRYGGSFENRARLLLECSQAVRAVWPADKPLWVRLSTTDWVEGGWSVEDSIRLARDLKACGVDLIDCSSGGTSPQQTIYAVAGYQVEYAARIRREAEIPTGAVGLITTAEQAEGILQAGQADVVLMAREFLRDPYFPLHAAKALGAPDAVRWPNQYLRAIGR